MLLADFHVGPFLGATSLSSTTDGSKVYRETHRIKTQVNLEPIAVRAAIRHLASSLLFLDQHPGHPTLGRVCK